MSKEKKTPEEEKDSGYIEVSLPNLSGIKDKLDGKLEQASDIVNEFGTTQIARDISVMFEKGRVGLDPALARTGIGFAIASTVLVVVALVLGAPIWMLGFLAFIWILCAVLYFLGKYEIRYDGDGFSTRVGKKELHRYAWSDVTDVTDKKKVFVNGKRLFADSSMHGFDRFYHRARAACKGKGKTVPSEKKRKQRKKNVGK